MNSHGVSSLEFRNIPVKFLGKGVIPKNAENERELMSAFIKDKSGRKDKLKGFSKDLLLTLSPTNGYLEVLPKSGTGQSLKLRLENIGSIANLSTKFSFVEHSDDLTETTHAMYAFQFKKWTETEAARFFNAFDKACNVNIDDTLFNTMSTLSASPRRPSGVPQDIGLMQVKLDDLEKTVLEERSRASDAEAARLSSELRRVTAEKETEELHTVMEKLRKEMALAAADMSAELAKMKLDFSEERANEIMQELQDMKHLMLSQHSEQQQLLIVQQEMQKKNRSSKPSFQRDRSSQKLMDIATRLSNGATSVSDSNFNQDVNNLKSMNQEGLIQLVQKQSQELSTLQEESLKKKSLEIELANALNENRSLHQQVTLLEHRLETSNKEKQYLANTISALEDKVTVNTSNALPSDSSLQLASGLRVLQHGDAVKEEVKFGLRGVDDDDDDSKDSSSARQQPIPPRRVDGSSNNIATSTIAPLADLNKENSQQNISSDIGTIPTTTSEGFNKIMDALNHDDYSDTEDNRDNGEDEKLIEVNLNKGSGGLGITIAGGLDQMVSPGDASVYITTIVENGVADRSGQLEAGDRILEVDRVDVRQVSHSEVVTALKQSGSVVRLLVSRAVGDGMVSMGSLFTNSKGASVESFLNTQESVDSLLYQGDSSENVIQSNSNNNNPQVSPPQNGQNEKPIEAGVDEGEEVLDIVIKKVNGGLGFSIAGGRDAPIEDEDPSVYVTSILQGGAAALNGELQIGDKIIKVNGQSVVDSLHQDIVQLLAAKSDEVRLQVSRLLDYDLDEEEVLVDVELVKQPGKGYGFSIAGGIDMQVAEGDDAIYISHIIPNETADMDGRLQIGDRLIEVNGQSVTNVEHSFVASLIKNSNESVHLVLARVWTGQEELVEIEFERGVGGLGFSIAGGLDDPEAPGDYGIYVVQIIEGGSAARDGKLMDGDRIIEVNGNSCEDVTHDQAVALLQENTPTIKLVVSRVVEDFGVTEEIIDIEFIKSPTHGLGFSIAGGRDAELEEGEPGIFISEINPEGPAAVDGRLKFGDKLLQVDESSLEDVTHQGAVDVLRSCDSTVRLKVLRVVQGDDVSDDEEEEEEIMEVLLKKVQGSLGFSIAGGIDDPVELGDTGIYITTIIDDGAAHQNGNLQVGDKILSVNGEDMANVEHHICVHALQSSGNEVQLVISRLPLDFSQQEDLLHEQNA
eukprot:m.136953 g.136953  ORF g.136953 m.136953 type:complete len:1199 (-) comp11084_c0_seq1:201-3797(-)